MRVELEPIFVLHTRPYRDTSLLVDIFSQNYGCLTLVAKGARKPKQNQRHLLQPFIPLLASWQGKSQLKTLIAIEAVADRYNLQGKFLYSGMYANELLSYLLTSGDAAPDIFKLYHSLLQYLNEKNELEPGLRRFELLLLSELGYGIDFTSEAINGDSIQASQHYGLIVDRGFVAEEYCSDQNPACYSGEQLLHIAKDQYESDEVRRAAKKITRLALQAHLKGKQLKSRELFR
ncbi:MAG: DNA repair protein RecO [Cellvibrionaceae bacterium]